MNHTNLSHAAWALAIQLGAGVPMLFLGVPGALWMTGAFAVGFFLSREHAQRECQVSLASGRPVETLEPLEGFRGWVLDRYLDAGCPAVACAVVAIAGSW